MRLYGCEIIQIIQKKRLINIASCFLYRKLIQIVIVDDVFDAHVSSFRD